MPNTVSFSRRLWTTAAVIVVLSTPQTQAAEVPAYNSAAELDLSLLLPSPPPLNSLQQQADIEAILGAQKLASAARLEQAVKDSKGSVFDMFTPVLGQKFEPKTLPATAQLFERLAQSETAAVKLAQAYFKRPRPFTQDPRIQVLSNASMMSADMAKAKGEMLPESGSWPSGRATRVSAFAIVLAHLLPKHKDALWQRALDYAHSRVIAGMHYPSDLEMGYRAGTALAAVLMRDTEFRAELQAVQQELKAQL